MELSSERYRRALLFVFVAAFALRIAVAATFQGLDAPPDRQAFPDQVEYERLAYSLSQGDGYAYADGEPTALRAPGTALTLLPVYLTFGRSFAAARIWTCLLSALTCVAVAWFAAPAFGRLAALCGALVLAFDPGHFYYSQHLVSEVPFGFYGLAGTYLALRALRAEGAWRGWAVAAGLVLGFAMLVRPQLVLLFPFGALAALATPRELRGRTLRRVALQAACAFLVLVPWVARNAVVMGSPTLSTISGILFWGAHNEVVTSNPYTIGSWSPVTDMLPPDWPEGEVESASRAWNEGFAFLRANPGRIPDLIFHKYLRFFSPYAGTLNPLLKLSWAAAWWISGPLFVFGVVLARRRDRAATVLLGLHIAVILATTLIFHGQVRYRHTVNPVIAVFCGVALAAVVSAWVGVRRRTPSAPAPGP